jgi:hypothetical protein
MEIKYGLISSDSHGQLGKDAYTSRMSGSKWGDRIPHVVEVREEKFAHAVERWVVHGELQGGNVCNCPTAMVNRKYYPKCYSPMAREERFSTAMRILSWPACALTTMRWPNSAG